MSAEGGGRGAEERGAVRPRHGRALRIASRLAEAYPDARCALLFSSPLECLVATVLSAQCTDARVNIVTRDLFKKYRSARDYASAPREDLEADIRSTGFYRNKARAIQAFCQALVRDHGGKVPTSMEDLVRLPGVGRKTANLVLGESFGIAAGIVVDTHVHRVSRRLGLSRHDDPEKIETDLMDSIPREEWITFGTLMIAHGRKVCEARKPSCAGCPLLEECAFGAREVARAARGGRGRDRNRRRMG